MFDNRTPFQYRTCVLIPLFVYPIISKPILLIIAILVLKFVRTAKVLCVNRGKAVFSFFCIYAKEAGRDAVAY